MNNGEPFWADEKDITPICCIQCGVNINVVKHPHCFTLFGVWFPPKEFCSEECFNSYPGYKEGVIQRLPEDFFTAKKVTIQ